MRLRRRARRVYEPERERRAEGRARELLRSVVTRLEYDMYEELGFISVEGAVGRGGYAYLLYPHRPIVAYASGSGEALNEYCVAFRDDSDPAVGTRLPAADDVLAKWMSLRGDERNLIARANMSAPGRLVDPAQVRRDITALGAWLAARP